MIDEARLFEKIDLRSIKDNVRKELPHKSVFKELLLRERDEVERWEYLGKLLMYWQIVKMSKEIDNLDGYKLF